MSHYSPLLGEKRGRYYSGLMSNPVIMYCNLPPYRNFCLLFSKERNEVLSSIQLFTPSLKSFVSIATLLAAREDQSRISPVKAGPSTAIHKVYKHFTSNSKNNTILHIKRIVHPNLKTKEDILKKVGPIHFF